MIIKEGKKERTVEKGLPGLFMETSKGFWRKEKNYILKNL